MVYNEHAPVGQFDVFPDCYHALLSIVVGLQGFCWLVTREWANMLRKLLRYFSMQELLMEPLPFYRRAGWRRGGRPCVAHSNANWAKNTIRSSTQYLSLQGRMVEEESTGCLLFFRSHSAPGRWKRDIPKLRTMKRSTAAL